MFPLMSHGANLFNICPFPDSSALYVQNWFPIRPAVWPQFPSLLNCWSHKTTHNAALGYRGANCLSLCPFPDESTDMYQIWYQSVQPFDSFPRRLNVWPPNPPPPRHATWGIEGWLVFSLCPFPDESADVNQSWCQSAQPFDSFPWLLNDWPPKTPQMPPCVSQGNLFGVYPFPDESAHGYQMWCQSDQPFDIFPWLLNLWPPNPPNVEGRIVFSICPFPDESADVYHIWCQSVQSFDSLPRLLDLWPPKPPPPPEMPPCVLRFNWFGIYPFPDESAHVCQIWCQSVQRFGSFSWICAKLVQLLATGRAVSRKNTPKNNIYTSKMIIPARTYRHQRH